MKLAISIKKAVAIILIFTFGIVPSPTSFANNIDPAFNISTATTSNTETSQTTTSPSTSTQTSDSEDSAVTPVVKPDGSVAVIGSEQNLANTLLSTESTYYKTVTTSAFECASGNTCNESGNIKTTTYFNSYGDKLGDIAEFTPSEGSDNKATTFVYPTNGESFEVIGSIDEDEFFIKKQDGAVFRIQKTEDNYEMTLMPRGQEISEDMALRTEQILGERPASVIIEASPGACSETEDGTQSCSSIISHQFLDDLGRTIGVMTETEYTFSDISSFEETWQKVNPENTYQHLQTEYFEFGEDYFWYQAFDAERRLVIDDVEWTNGDIETFEYFYNNESDPQNYSESIHTVTIAGILTQQQHYYYSTDQNGNSVVIATGFDRTNGLDIFNATATLTRADTGITEHYSVESTTYYFPLGINASTTLNDIVQIANTKHVYETLPDSTEVMRVSFNVDGQGFPENPTYVQKGDQYFLVVGTEDREGETGDDILMKSETQTVSAEGKSYEVAWLPPAFEMLEDGSYAYFPAAIEFYNPENGETVFADYPATVTLNEKVFIMTASPHGEVMLTPALRGVEVPAALAEEATRILGKTPDSMIVETMATPCAPIEGAQCESVASHQFLDDLGRTIGFMTEIETNIYPDIFSFEETWESFEADGTKKPIQTEYFEFRNDYSVYQFFDEKNRLLIDDVEWTNGDIETFEYFYNNESDPQNYSESIHTVTIAGILTQQQHYYYSTDQNGNSVVIATGFDRTNGLDIFNATATLTRADTGITEHYSVESTTYYFPLGINASTTLNDIVQIANTKYVYETLPDSTEVMRVSFNVDGQGFPANPTYVQKDDQYFLVVGTEDREGETGDDILMKSETQTVSAEGKSYEAAWWLPAFERLEDGSYAYFPAAIEFYNEESGETVFVDMPAANPVVELNGIEYNISIVDGRITLSKTLPTVIADYVANLQSQIGNGFNVTAEPSDEGTFLVKVVRYHHCPEGAFCAPMLLAPGAFSSLELKLNADGTRKEGSISANYNGIVVEGSDADLLFKATTTCPQGEICAVNVMEESDASIFRKMSEITVSEANASEIYFSKGGINYKTYRDSNSQVVVEEIKLIQKIDITPEENLTISAIFGGLAAYKKITTPEVTCEAVDAGCNWSMAEFFDANNKLIGSRTDRDLPSDPTVFKKADGSPIEFQTEITDGGSAQNILGQTPRYQITRSVRPEPPQKMLSTDTVFYFDDHYQLIGWLHVLEGSTRTWFDANNNNILEQTRVSAKDPSDEAATVGGILGQNPVWKSQKTNSDGSIITTYYDENSTSLGTKTIIQSDEQTTVTTWLGAEGNTKETRTVTTHEDGTVETVIQDELRRITFKYIEWVNDDLETLEYIYNNASDPQNYSEVVQTIETADFFIQRNYYYSTDPAGNSIEIVAGFEIDAQNEPFYTLDITVTSVDGNHSEHYSAQSTAFDFGLEIDALTPLETVIPMTNTKVVHDSVSDSEQVARVYFNVDGSGFSANPTYVQRNNQYFLVGEGGTEILMRAPQEVMADGQSYEASWWLPAFEMLEDGSYAYFPAAIEFYNEESGETVFAEYPGTVTLDGKVFKMAISNEGAIILVEFNMEALLATLTEKVAAAQAESSDRLSALLILLDEARQSSAANVQNFEAEFNDLVASLQALLAEMLTVVDQSTPTPLNRDAIQQKLNEIQTYLTDALPDQRELYLRELREELIRSIQYQIEDEQTLQQRLAEYQTTINAASSVQELESYELQFPQIIPQVGALPPATDPRDVIRAFMIEGRRLLDNTLPPEETPAIKAVKTLLVNDLMKTFGLSKTMLDEFLASGAIRISIDLEARTARVSLDSSATLPSGVANLFNPLGSNALPNEISYVLGLTQPTLIGAPCSMSADGSVADCPPEPEPTYYLDSASFMIDRQTFALFYIEEGLVETPEAFVGDNKLHKVIVSELTDNCSEDGSVCTGGFFISPVSEINYVYRDDGKVIAQFSGNTTVDDGRSLRKDIHLQLKDNGTYRITEVIELDHNGNPSVKNEFIYSAPACDPSVEICLMMTEPYPADSLIRINRTDMNGKNLSTIEMTSYSNLSRFSLIDGTTQSTVLGAFAVLKLPNGESFSIQYKSLQNLLAQARDIELENSFKQAQAEMIAQTQAAMEENESRIAFIQAELQRIQDSNLAQQSIDQFRIRLAEAVARMEGLILEMQKIADTDLSRASDADAFRTLLDEMRAYLAGEMQTQATGYESFLVNSLTYQLRNELNQRANDNPTSYRSILENHLVYLENATTLEALNVPEAKVPKFNLSEIMMSPPIGPLTVIEQMASRAEAMIMDALKLPENAVALADVEQELAIQALELDASRVGQLYKTTETIACVTSPCAEEGTKEMIYTEAGHFVGTKHIVGTKTTFKNALGEIVKELEEVTDEDELQLVRALAEKSTTYGSAFERVWQVLQSAVPTYIVAYASDEDEENRKKRMRLVFLS